MVHAQPRSSSALRRWLILEWTDFLNKETWRKRSEGAKIWKIELAIVALSEKSAASGKCISYFFLNLRVKL